MSQIYSEKRRQYTLMKNNPRNMVERVASDIEKLLAKKRKALSVSDLKSEYSHALNRSYMTSLQSDALIECQKTSH